MGKYFFILVDACTKWPELHIMQNITTEATIEICRKIFSTFGIPAIFASDNGSQFTSSEFQQFLRVNGIVHRRGAPYHPATNGQAERYVRTFKDKLKTLKCKPSELSREICTFLMSYRRTIHPATGKSPAMAMFNRQIVSRLDLFFKKQATESASAQRAFLVGERVAARDYLGQDKWQFGIITSKLGSLHYDILLDDGRTWKRHTDQIIRIGEHVPSTQTPSPTVQRTQPQVSNTAEPSTSTQSPTSSPTTPTTSSNETAQKNHTPSIVTASSIATSKPQRNIRRPNRFTYETLGEPAVEGNVPN